MTNEEILSRLHELELLLVDEVVRICKRHGIPYFLAAGSMLGALRHEGFIPWDDDVDIGMLREDYERFLEVCEREIDGERFYLQTEEKEKYYPFGFAKLRLKGTNVAETFGVGAKGKENGAGVYVDIFPFDTVPDDEKKRRRLYRKYWFYRNLLFVKCGFGKASQKKRGLRLVGAFLSRFFSVGFLKKRKRVLITGLRGEKTEFVVNADGGYGLEKETIRRCWVENTAEFRFEGRLLCGVSDAEAYLSYLYGDFRKLPPESERNHHGRLSVDFGPYGPSAEKCE